ncbi:MAG: FIST N-terminal domain-containing protein, partial [Myxococcota bacterium]
MRVFVGHTDDPSPQHAVDEVIEQIEGRLQGRAPRGALLYSCIDFDHQTLLDGIQRRWPGLPLVGCTTDGECSSTNAFMEDSVVLTVFEGDELDLRVGLGRGLREDPDRAGAEAAAQIRSNAPPALVIAVPDSIGVSGARVVDALNRHLPAESVVVGGTAGDQWQFRETRQFFGDQVLTGVLPLLAIGGRVRVSVGVASGWRPIGRVGQVTRADAAVVHEIDGKPAIEFLRTNAGVQAHATPEYPFAIRTGPDDGFVLRAPMDTSPTDGSITFAGDVPQGAQVQITEAGRAQILEGARSAARQAFEGYDSAKPDAMLIFSCAARKQVLGTRCSEEIGLLLDGQPALDAAG